MAGPAVVVAVDGPVAAGKGTLARRLAGHFGLAYLDTGTLYRAVGLKLLIQGADPEDPALALAAARAIGAGDLSAPALRDEATGMAASKIAAMPQVRAALLDYQRRFAAAPPAGGRGAVLDGRDIGTIVCPHAQAKLFVTARPEVRAHRRYRELVARSRAAGTAGAQVSEAEVLADLLLRDAGDRERIVAPLTPAADAYLLDTSDLDIEGAFAAARAFVESKL